MSEFKNYIDSILNDVVIDSNSRKDIIDEIEDHLKLSKQEYINKGYSEKVSIEMAIRSFGEVKKIKSKYIITFSPFNTAIKILAAILFVGYILLFIKLSFLNTFSKFTSINFIPFQSISQYLFNYNSFKRVTWFTNFLGMIIAFIPFGFIIPIIHNRINRVNKIIILSIALSFLTEVLQHITKRGVADIDDIILNTVGGILGYVLLKLVLKFMLLLKNTVIAVINVVKTKNNNSYSD